MGQVWYGFRVRVRVRVQVRVTHLPLPISRFGIATVELPEVARPEDGDRAGDEDGDGDRGMLPEVATWTITLTHNSVLFSKP